MKKLLLILLLNSSLGWVLAQPGNYYPLCFKLYDSNFIEIDSADIAENYSFRFVNPNDDNCEGISFINDSLWCCLITSNKHCAFNSLLQIIYHKTDTMRVFYRYKSFDEKTIDCIVGKVTFMKGNYIVKSPPSLNDWKEVNRKESCIVKIKNRTEMLLVR